MTCASSQNQHVQGKENVIDSSGVYAHIVGNGTPRGRHNAHALDWNGNAYYEGTVYVKGTNPDASGGQEVATKSGWTANKYIGTDENGNLIEKDAPAGGGSGDMQKSVYDPNNNAKDIFKYADDAAKKEVANHTSSGDAHSDIRDLITGLTNRLNAIADSDDTTLDQLSEIVAYIKSNKGLIDSITTSKISVSDIVDNLTSSATNKPLSAAQGKALKELIDAITTMTGATADTDGAAGLVPAPKAGEQEKFLRGDGTWVEADKTLSKDGYAADAKVVGEKISELSGKIDSIPSGKDGITPTIGDNGNWYLGDTDTGKPSRGETGPAGADGKDGAPGAAGADGKTPVKGTDYWTADDQQAIVNDVLMALPTWEGGSY